jgi:aromatic-L-amino-acid/L-tryptophan decarboxylase
MIFRYVPEKEDADDFNLQIIEEIKKDGKVFLSSTRLNGNVWLRLAVLSFRTHKSTIDYTLNLLKKIVKKKTFNS